MDEQDAKFTADLEKLLKEHHAKAALLEHLRGVLFKNQTASRQNFLLVFLGLHNWIENILDGILKSYLGPQRLEEETMRALCAGMEPSEVCNELIFNFGFDNKSNLICTLFSISEPTRQCLKSLNKIRNGLAHRYKDNDQYFVYGKKNVITDLEGLRKFLASSSRALTEITDLDERMAKYFE